MPAGWEVLPRAISSVADRTRDLVIGLPRSLPHLAPLPGAQRCPGVRALERGRVGGARARRAAGRRAGRARALTAPRTPFNGPITAHRRFAYASVPLDEVKQVKNAFGMTVNDVVLALTAGVLRRWLLDRDALPAAPLVAAVPVSVRDDESESRRQPGVGHGRGAADEPCRPGRPARGRAEPRWRRPRRSSTRCRRRSCRTCRRCCRPRCPGSPSRALFRLMTAPGALFNLFVSNVPGPAAAAVHRRRTRSRASTPSRRSADVSGGLNITLFSYDGSLDVGFIACREMVPDLWVMAGYLRDELDALLALV